MDGDRAAHDAGYPRYDGLKDRPETTNGTVNADILEHFVPGLRRTTTVERIAGSAWPS